MVIMAYLVGSASYTHPSLTTKVTGTKMFKVVSTVIMVAIISPTILMARPNPVLSSRKVTTYSVQSMMHEAIAKK